MKRFLLSMILTIALSGLGTDPISAKTEGPCLAPIVIGPYTACVDDLPDVEVDPLEFSTFTDNIEVEPAANGAGAGDGFYFTHAIAISSARKATHPYHVWKKHWAPCLAILIADIDVIIIRIDQQEWRWRLIDFGSYTVGVLYGQTGLPILIKDFDQLRPLIQRQHRAAAEVCLAQRGKPI